MNKNDQSRTRALGVWFPLQVKQALSAESAREGVSINDLVGEVLGRSFAVAFTPSGRRPARTADPQNLQVVLRIPEALLEAVRERAFAKRTNMGAEVIKAVSDALGLAVELETQRTFPLGGGHPRLAA